MTVLDEQTPPRRPGELGAVELVRWSWRQLTSMRTALVLLLLLALAAVPGSVVPQQGVDSLKTSRWQQDHPRLTPIFDRLGLFSVYDSPWFAAVYLLLMVSLVGCIVPRTRVYWRALRARPPTAPVHLDRLPGHTTYHTTEDVATVHARAREVLAGRRYRLAAGDGPVSAEKGRLREAGNLLFHASLLVVLLGFAVGSLVGYKGGVIVVVGKGFSNNLTQYDDFVPGDLFSADWMEPFSFTVDDFDVEWLDTGPRAGQARGFVAHLDYRESPTSAPADYDLRVNHPLTIGSTDVFLIGHGYAPVITVRDGNGDVAYTGPTVFLPEDTTFRSFGVVKAPDARPTQLGLEGEFYPTYAFTEETGPFSVYGRDDNPVISMLVYAGDLGMDGDTPQSVYVLDKDDAEPVRKADGSMFRVDLALGDSVRLPGGRGSVSFDGLERWNKIQISRTPGSWVALLGVCLALVGLLLSLFVRPRRLWVRALPAGPGGHDPLRQGTIVEVGCLDRSGGGDPAAEAAAVAALLRRESTRDPVEERA